MPKVKTIQTNFSAGELSPQAYGRVDIARYPNAASQLENVISRTLGGAQKRPGTEYLHEVKDSTKKSRLVPYTINRDKSYMLEFADTVMRVYKMDGTPVMNGGSPYEITTPYSITQVQDMDYCQGEDTMYLFHKNVPIQRLRTFADNRWDCSPAPFTAEPFQEVGEYPPANLTLNSNSVGIGRTMAASSATFLASDVGRAILHKSGIFVITAFTDSQNVTGEVKIIFDSTSIPGGEWNLDASPQAALTPNLASPVGATVTLTLSAAGWRTGNVGSYVRVNGGLVKIVSFSSSTVVSGVIKSALSSTTAAPALSWTLESSIWSALFGYPQTGIMHQQRLAVGGTVRNPQTVVGSRSGEPLDYTKGTADDDSYLFTIDTSQNKVGPINYLVSLRDLVALTDGGEFSVRGGVEKPITPTNVRLPSETGRGSRRVKPVAVGKEILFVQRAGKKLRAIGYQYDEDGYKTPDITTLGEHLTQAGIFSMAQQQEPDQIVWVALENGKFCSVTFDRDLDIIAWCRQVTDGAVESIASMPAGDTEQVWMTVRRKLGDGTIKRYIERLQPEWYPIYGTSDPDPDEFPPQDPAYSWGFQLDCAISQDSDPGKSVWDGLDHLEGREIRVVADGVDMGEFTVDGGEITLPRAAHRVLAGLFFAPVIIPLRPEIGTGEGTSQAALMSTNEITLRLYNTIGATVDGAQVAPGRSYSEDQLDMPPELFTGDVSISTTGWEKGNSEKVISQDAPLPFYVLAIIRSITVNNG